LVNIYLPPHPRAEDNVLLFPRGRRPKIQFCILTLSLRIFSITFNIVPSPPPIITFGRERGTKAIKITLTPLLIIF